jgi:anthranilate synthase component 2
MHGKTSQIQHADMGVFEGMPNPFTATRYHSLTIAHVSLPDCLKVTATAVDDGEIMGIRHRSLPIEGVQFHPESVLTQEGKRLLGNFLKQRC